MRYTMTIESNLRKEFEEIAAQQHTTFPDLIERGIRAIGLIREQRELGRTHFGFVSDPTKLDVELRGLFPERPHVVEQR